MPSKVRQRARVIVDSEKCIGCRICEFICSISKEGVFSREKSEIKIMKRSENSYLPIVCKQCENAVCEKICPVDAIGRYKEAVTVSPILCNGCGYCVSLCPIGAIRLDSRSMVAKNCDLCGGYPACTNYCPTGALVLEDLSSTSSRRRKELLHELATK